jgi:hypothetical protein
VVERNKPGVKARAKEEGRKLLVGAVFFSIGFCVILIHNRLYVEGSQVETASFARALIGGVIVAKVLLTVDVLPFVDIFPHKPMIHNIAWKTSLYLAASLVFLYAEPFLLHLIKGAGLHGSHSQAWHELMLPRTWALVVSLAVLFLGFVVMQELSRVIGRDQLKYMFFGRRGKRTIEVRSRDAA